jgi:hypothetical protein
VGLFCPLNLEECADYRSISVRFNFQSAAHLLQALSPATGTDTCATRVHAEVEFAELQSRMTTLQTEINQLTWQFWVTSDDNDAWVRPAFQENLSRAPLESQVNSFDG